MILKIALAILLLSPSVVYAYDWTQDANCVGAWLFTEGSGETVADSSVNSNTGTFKDAGQPAWTSMAGTNAPSYADYSVNFDGSDDFISMGDVTILDGATAATVSLWIKYDTVNASRATIGKWGNASNDQTFTIISGDDEFTVGWKEPSASGDNLQVFSTTDANVTDSQWYHVAATFTATQSVKLYLDGVSKSISKSVNGTVSTLRNSGTDLEFGFEADESRTAIDGDESESAIFDDEKDSTDINDIMDNGLLQAVAAARRRMWIM